MPIELLRELAAHTLPREIKSEAEIDKVRVLEASGMVVAELPPIGQDGCATVKEITGYGRATLKAKGSSTPDL